MSGGVPGSHTAHDIVRDASQPDGNHVQQQHENRVLNRGTNSVPPADPSLFPVPTPSGIVHQIYTVLESVSVFI